MLKWTSCIEIVMTVFLLGLLSVVVVPSFREFIDGNFPGGMKCLMLGSIVLVSFVTALFKPYFGRWAMRLHERSGQ